MTSSRRRWCWQILTSAVVVNGAIANCGCAFAQLAGDNTLGAESSIVTSTSPGKSQIDGGATRGRNLFHSFSEFSVPTGGSVFFNNASDIQNIISRVTGSSISNIDGLIGANGRANLFLLNPNGIIFGANAALNIGGSFVASTAFSMKFSDGVQFSATANPSELLTVNVPLGLQFGANPSSIRNLSQSNSVGLQVATGKTLALVGGNVSLEGGKLQAVGGRLELGGLSAAGTVELNDAGNSLSLSFPAAQEVPRADVSLSEQALVNVTAPLGGGSIALNVRNLDMQGRSQIAAGIKSRAGSLNARPGDININATNTISLRQQSRVRNAINENATGIGSDINITTKSLDVTDGSLLNASTYGRGDAGNVNIKAQDISLDGVLFDIAPTGDNSTVTGPFSGVEKGGVGNGGNVNITTRSLTVTNGAGLSASTSGKGNAGNVNIKAQDISLDGVGGQSSGAYSRVRLGAEGNGGSINITTDSLAVTNGAQLIASTSGRGDAGSVNINAHDISFDGESSNGTVSGAYSRVEKDGVGNGGNINITSRSLSVTNGAVLIVSTYGKGDAGSVNITASDKVSFAGISSRGSPSPSGVFSTIRTGSLGKGGSINITTDLLSLNNGSEVNLSNLSSGNAGDLNVRAGSVVLDNQGKFKTESVSGAGGNITLRVQDSLQLRHNSQISATGGTAAASGNGGNVKISTGLLSLNNGSEVNVSNLGLGNAGNLNVRASSVILDNQGKFRAESTSGAGGNVTLRVQDLLLLRHNSQISATGGTAAAPGNGGNIDINAKFIVAVPSENSDIKANAFLGQGGKVTINSQRLFGLTVLNLKELQSLLGTKEPAKLDPLNLSSSNITAISQTDPSLSGQVTINALNVDPSRGLANLPVELVDVSGLMAQSCRGGGDNADRGTSEFIVTGRGGLPPSPDNLLSSDAVVVSLVTPAGQAENIASSKLEHSPPPMLDKIVEAQGWVIGADGKVFLTATASTASPQIPWLRPTGCHVP